MRRAADVSRNHRRHITTNAETGDPSTEDLRQAMIHYRALFSELLGDADKVTAEADPDAEEYPASGAPADDSGDATRSRAKRR